MNITTCEISDKQRHDMIAEAAYYQAEKRGHSGDPTAEWLAAEADFEAAFTANCGQAHGTIEDSVYHRIRNQAHRLLKRSEGANGPGTVRRALTRVGSDAKRFRVQLPASIIRASESVRREIADVAGKRGYSWEALRIRGNVLLKSLKTSGTGTLKHTSDSVRRRLGRWRDRNGH